MKKLLNVLIPLLLLVACQENQTYKAEEVKTEVEPTLIGVWEMTDRYFFENGELQDSVKVTPDRRGVKIFTKNKYMWCGKPVPEGKEYFAFGTYSMTDSTFTERKEYAAKAMEGHSTKSTMKLILAHNSYTQIHFDSLGAFYAEKYNRIE